ncbi:acetyltransferase [Winogradskyella immobilis]|uniref:Acetyltransferase n=1 Tax=Winogradskyella immobilis TaxID=2816852 RepID=A0ABS8ENW7_9FLAO|nr:acetyltransferase [Winogradskyella immobilis]MCC1484906.1 acetyltransferase [Winogradskyella immobilis]MCG0016998.1 acetyltransferase [Winogradskyella immobilis]
MNKVVIFGLKDFAELAHYYLTNDSDYDVVAFTVHQEFLPEEKTFKGVPIVAFETVEELYPVSAFLFFVPMDPKKMNTLREAVYLEVKHKGYQFISYISSKATVLTDSIGENCFILEDNTIQPFVTIGNCVVMWSGNHIGHHSVIKDYVNFTSHVVLSGHCKIERYSFFGVNATIRDSITIAEGTFVGMSATIIKDTEAWGVYIGNPAKRLENKHSKDVEL